MAANGHFLYTAKDNFATICSKIVNEESFSTNSEVLHLMRAFIFLFEGRLDLKIQDGHQLSFFYIWKKVTLELFAVKSYMRIHFRLIHSAATNEMINF